MVHVTSVDDPRLAPYRLMRDGDLLRAHDLCILEGKTVIAHALTASRYPLQSLLIAEHKIADCAGLIALAKMEVLTAPSEFLNALVGFKFHRGVVALAHRKAAQPTTQKTGLALALCGITNDENMGAIFRSAAALGVQTIHLDATCCDPLYRKAIRVSSGTTLSLPFQKYGDMAAMITRLQRNGYQPIAMTPKATTDLTDYRPSGKTPLIVLGSEGEGLPDAIIEMCDGVKIPMARNVDSLNVGAAAAIAIYAIGQAILKHPHP